MSSIAAYFTSKISEHFENWKKSQDFSKPALVYPGRLLLRAFDAKLIQEILDQLQTKGIQFKEPGSDSGFVLAIQDHSSYDNLSYNKVSTDALVRERNREGAFFALLIVPETIPTLEQVTRLDQHKIENLNEVHEWVDIAAKMSRDESMLTEKDRHDLAQFVYHVMEPGWDKKPVIPLKSMSSFIELVIKDTKKEGLLSKALGKNCTVLGGINRGGAFDDLQNNPSRYKATLRRIVNSTLSADIDFWQGVLNSRQIEFSVIQENIEKILTQSPEYKEFCEEIGNYFKLFFDNKREEFEAVKAEIQQKYDYTFPFERVLKEKKVTKKKALGEETISHFECEDENLSEREIDLLVRLDTSSSTDDNETDLLQFYDQRRRVISKNPKLDRSWLNTISKDKEIECFDLSVGIHLALSKHILHSQLSNGKRVRLRLIQSRTKKTLGTKNKEALFFFFNEYKDLEEFWCSFGDEFYTDFPAVFEPCFLNEELLRSGRTGRDSNSLLFQVSLMSTEGGEKEQPIQNWNILWRFKPQSMANVKYDDLNYIRSHEISFDSNHKVEIDPSKTKFIDSQPSIEDRNIFIKPIRSLKSGCIFGKKDYPENTNVFTDQLERLVNDTLISKEQHEALLHSFNELGSLWLQAISNIQSSPMTCDLSSFTDSYLTYLNELVELNKVERIDSQFQSLVYEFINLQSIFVSKVSNYQILPPWHPFSIIYKGQRNSIYSIISSTFKNGTFKIGNRIEPGAFDEAYLSLFESLGKGLLIQKNSKEESDLICTNSEFGYYEYGHIVDSKNTLPPSEIKQVVFNTTSNFLNIYPQEKHHLMLVFEGLQSFEQVEAAYSSLLEISESSDDEVSTTAVFTSMNTTFLEKTYERFCNSFDEEKVDPSIRILIKDYHEKFQDEEVDILFSFDPLFRDNEVSSNPDKYFIDSGLKSLWEQTNTRKVPTVLSSDNPSFSLNSHIQNKDTAILHKAVMKSAGKTPDYSFYREVSGSTLVDVLPNYLDNTNWLAIYDFLINKDVLNRSAKDQSYILRFVQGTGDKRSLGLLTQKETTHLTQNLESQLIGWGLASSDIANSLSQSVFEKANSFNSDILLRATSDSNISHDILGTTLAASLLEDYFISLGHASLFDVFWIHLDDYMHWFKASDYNGDKFKALGVAANYISDLLGITITESDGIHTLHLIICESKLTKSNTDNLHEKSAKQLRATIKLLKNMLSDREAFDYYFWLNKFFEFIVVNAKFSHSTFPFEDLLSIDKDNIVIKLYGASLIFHYGDSLDSSQGMRLFKDEEESLYQIRLNTFDTKKALLHLNNDKNDGSRLCLSQFVDIKPEDLNQSCESPVDSNYTPLVSSKEQVMFSDVRIDTTNDTLTPSTIEPYADSNEALKQKKQQEFTTVERKASTEKDSLISSVIEFLRQETEHQDVDPINIDEIKKGVREIFNHSNLPSQFIQEVVTPNSILVKLKGDLRHSTRTILGLKDSFLSVAGLSLRQAYADRGQTVLVFDRERRQTVYFADLLERSITQRKNTIQLGYNNTIILGQNEYEDELCYFRLDGPSPHALIGGQTKSGKSVLLNNMITDLMITNHPNHLRLWLFDPKQVEFSIYSRSPHLAHPVIFEKELAISCLEEIESLMNDRYSKLRELGLRDVETYNKKHPDSPMSREVVFFDEVADWFLDDDFKRDAKDIVSRLSSKGRAAGIHLILATQRPSNDVVTPLLRANLDTKIALKVDRELNSNIILGESGAENLLGYGHGIVKTEGETFNIQVGFTDSYLFDEVVDMVIQYWKQEMAM
ncbi:MAG TPA: FtsK/SpoIIIE domain-containing protein [Chitinophagales bacterium]|nr:FtsK/SpoIIIE domain-containing protein [Chitinophagales bacterium]